MTINLSSETQRLLEQRLKSGAYASVDVLVREALRALDVRNQEEADFCLLRSKLERGMAQAERGELVDGELVFERALQRLAERR